MPAAVPSMMPYRLPAGSVSTACEMSVSPPCRWPRRAPPPRSRPTSVLGDLAIFRVDLADPTVIAASP
jgi:hypothetical protein